MAKKKKKKRVKKSRKKSRRVKKSRKKTRKVKRSRKRKVSKKRQTFKAPNQSKDSDGNTINRRASKESVFIAVNSANDINELADRRILSKETVEALKEYAQEVNDDINTRESRERDRGAATGAEQEGLRAGPTAPIQTAKKTATEVVDETDGDAVAATGPDTGQFTGGERGVYPTLNGAAVRWFVDGLPFGLKSLVGTYSIEKDSNGNDQGKITYDRKQVEREASIQDYANQPDYKISIDKDDVLKHFDQSHFYDSNETSSQKEEYLIALERVLQTRDEIDSFIKDYNIEALVGLSWSPAWAINHDGGDDEAIAEYKFWVNGSFAAMAGYPHVTIPFEYVDDLPIGMSFIGSKWDDKKLIEYAYAAEQLIQFKAKPNL